MEGQDHDLLVEIHTTVKGMKEKIDSIEDNMTANYVRKEEFRPICDNYVSQVEFKPVKGITYGMVILILTAVIGAILSYVVTGKVSAYEGTNNTITVTK